MKEKLNVLKLSASKKKGISPIIATLLLILIAIAAGVVVYAYVLGFVGNSTGNTGGQIAQLQIEQVYFSSSSSAVPVMAFVLNKGPVADSFTSNFYVSSSSLNQQLGPAITVTCSSGCTGAATYTIPATAFKLTGTGSNSITVSVASSAITCAGSPGALTVSVFGLAAQNIATCSSGSVTPATPSFTLATGVVVSSTLATSAGSPSAQTITSSTPLVYGVIITAGSITVPVNTVFQFNLAQQGVGTNPLISSTTYTLTVTGNDGATTSLSGKAS